MGKKFHKSIRIYFSKLKKIRTTMSLPNPPTTSSLLSACKHPKTSSFAVPAAGAHAATLSDVDRFLFENFQSLYIRDDDDDSDDVEESSHPSSPDVAANPSDVRTSTASSSAAIDPDSADVAAAAARVLPGESVAVVTFSKDPYDDFRRSMQDMVDARGQVELDWDFVGELLLCYLDLNDRTVHKHILRAFADIVVSFRRRPTTTRRRTRKKKPVMEE